MSWTEIKHALNSTLGTEDFQSLDKLISIRLAEFESAMKTPKYIWSEPGTYYWTVPDGIYKIYVTACGGGGGGSGAYMYRGNNPTAAGAGGGGGAAVLNKPIYVTPGDTGSIIIGRGGSGGNKSTSASSSVINGGDGRSTGLIFSDGSALRPNLSLPGGKGGTFSKTDYTSTGGAAGGDGGGKGGNGRYTNGSASGNEESGEAGIVGAVTEAEGRAGTGGGSLGVGGRTDSYQNASDNIVTPTFGGGGGGGDQQSSSYSLDGQDGADGYMLISFVEIDPSEIVPASSAASTLTYTEPQLMNEYSKGVESIG